MELQLILVNSDDFKHTLMTRSAYRALTLQMSSGDFGAHKHVRFKLSIKDVKYFKPNEPILDWDAHCGEFYQLQTFAEACEFYLHIRAMAKVIPFASKQYLRKDLTPRQRLLKNQRKLFRVEAEVIPLRNAI